MSRQISVSGVSLEIEEAGQGRPLLFLHPGEGLQANQAWLRTLAAGYRVIAPHHPGFGGSALPDWIGSVDDLAYLYLDLAAALELEGAVLAGNCFGGWVAAEMAVRNTARFAGLLLAAPLGIKAGGVLERDIVDMHAVSRSAFMRLAWADPSKGEIDYTVLPDTELAAIARGRRSAGGVRVETLHAQSAAEAVAAPDRHSDASGVGRAGWHCLDGLRRGVESRNSGRDDADDPGRRCIIRTGSSRMCSLPACVHLPTDFRSNVHAHLVFLGNGLSSGVAEGSRSGVAAGEFPQ